MPILLAAVASGLAMPLFERLLRLVKGRRALAATLTLLLLFLAVALPLGAFVGIVTAAGIEVATDAVPWVKRAVQEPSALIDRAYAAVPRLRDLEPYREPILSRAGEVDRDARQRAREQPLGDHRWHAALVARPFRSCLRDVLLPYWRPFRPRQNPGLPADATRRQGTAGRPLSLGGEGDAQGDAGRGSGAGHARRAGILGPGVRGAPFWAMLVFVLSVLPGVGAPLVWVPSRSTSWRSGAAPPLWGSRSGARPWSERSTTSCVRAWSAATPRCRTC